MASTTSCKRARSLLPPCYTLSSTNSSNNSSTSSSPGSDSTSSTFFVTASPRRPPVVPEASAVEVPVNRPPRPRLRQSCMQYVLPPPPPQQPQHRLLKDVSAARLARSILSHSHTLILVEERSMTANQTSAATATTCWLTSSQSAPSADASSSSSSPLSHEMPSSTSKTWMPIISNEYFVMEEETSGSETEYTSEEEEDELEMLDLWGENEVLSSIDEMNAYDQWLLSDPGLVAAVCRPRVFNEASSMAFYMTPLAMATMVQALLGRHASACVHMNLRIPREYLFDDMDWSSDALRMLYLPNAGGSSHLSEVLSFEILHRCLGAQLAETEMEIRYFFAYQPITDYTVTVPSLAGVVGYGPGRMHGHQGPVKLGVSVTRAFSFRGPYRRSDCRKLLRKKLRGIIESSKNVVGGKLYKQILHVLVPSGKVARTVYSTWKRMPAELVHNTVVVVSIVNAPWVFTNRR